MKNLFLALTLALVASACTHSAPVSGPGQHDHGPKTYGVNFGKQKGAITLVSGNNNDLAIAAGTGNTSTLIRLIADSSGSTLTGMDASTVSDGDLFFIRNEAASGVLTITNADSASLLANRFATANGASLQIPPKTGAIVWYDVGIGFNVFVAASGSPSLTGLKVGASGTSVSQVRIYSPSLTPVATAAAIGTTQQTFTVTGLATTDTIFVTTPVPTSLCPVTQARVSATDTLQLSFSTLTASACTPSAGTYVVYAVR